MAKLKIGEGIQLEAQLPQVNSEQEIPKGNITEGPSRLDTVSDRVYQLRDLLQKYVQDLAVLEEKVDDQRADFLGLMDQLNEIDMREPMEMISKPEIKQVTFHRDHTKDFEDVYQKIHLDKDELDTKLKNVVDKEQLMFNLKIQKLINLTLGVTSVISLVLHLI